MVNTPANRRAPSGTKPKPKGRSLKALSEIHKRQATVYFIAYRHKLWSKPLMADGDFIWEFYYSKPVGKDIPEDLRIGVERHGNSDRRPQADFQGPG